MTAQSMESLILKGKKVFMASEPLDDYLSTLTIRPNFKAESSGCWRGYYGSWEIKDNKLYLISFEGCIQKYKIHYEKGNTAPIWERKNLDVEMDYLFPNQKRVFAEWFSGEIRIPRGPLLRYVHSGYDSTFAFDLFLEFKNGKLIGKRRVHNYLTMIKEFINSLKEHDEYI